MYNRAVIGNPTFSLHTEEKFVNHIQLKAFFCCNSTFLCRMVQTKVGFGWFKKTTGTNLGQWSGQSVALLLWRP